jgi:hypothetical protein
MKRTAGVLAGTALLTTLVVGCHSGGGAASAARLQSDGRVEVADATGPWHLAAHNQKLRAGERVHVLAGSAIVRLVPDGTLELRAGSRLQLRSGPYLEAGDVLIEPAHHSLKVDTDRGDAVVANGAARLSQSSTLNLSVYRGGSQLLAKDAGVEVKAPRQTEVGATDAGPSAAMPLTYHPDDAWDHRYLAQAETLGRQLADAAVGFNGQLKPGAGTTPAFYEAALPTLNRYDDFAPAFNQVATQPTAVTRTPGDYLVGAAIALRGQAGSLGERWLQEFAFASQGANWGLVALDQNVSSVDQLTSDVLTAIGRAPLQFTLAGSSAGTIQGASFNPTNAIESFGVAGAAMAPLSLAAARRSTPTGITSVRVSGSVPQSGLAPWGYPLSPVAPLATTPGSSPTVVSGPTPIGPPPASPPAPGSGGVAPPIDVAPAPPQPSPPGTVLDPLVDPLLYAAQGVVTATTTAASTAINGLATTVKSTVDTVTTGLNNAVTAAAPGLSATVNTVTSGVSGAVAATTAGLNSAVSTATSAVNGAVAGVTSGLTSVVTNVGNSVGGLVNQLGLGKPPVTPPSTGTASSSTASSSTASSSTASPAAPSAAASAASTAPATTGVSSTHAVQTATVPAQ